MTIGYNIEILTSSLGFENNLQKYIAGARITPIFDDWIYTGTGTDKVSFNHRVYISYQDIVPDELLLAQQTESQFLMPKLPKDLFYPITIGY